MGWTGMEKPHNVAEWMKRQLTWESGERSNVCLDIAIVNRRTAYAAVKSTYADGTTSVWAAIYELEFIPRARSFETFRYKDMSEDVGPMAFDCPARILDLLTPTDSKYANEWRARCRERLDRRDANRLSDGDYIRFERPIAFNLDWGRTERDTFRMEMRQRGRGRTPVFVSITEDGHDGFECLISKWRDRPFKKLEGDDIPRPPQDGPRM